MIRRKALGRSLIPAHTFKHMKTRRSLAALVLSIAAAAALTLARVPVNPVWMLVLGGGVRVVLGALGV